MPKIFAISDLHLSFMADKPMNLFGQHWDNYEDKILTDWNSKLGPNDIGIIAGDISWAMKPAETDRDFDFIRKLNGKKILIRGNHDYWWSTITKVRELLGPDVIALQNDSVRLELSSTDDALARECAVLQLQNDNPTPKGIVFAGTRGWRVPERRQPQTAEDKKILAREIIRLELALKDAKIKLQPADTLIVIIHYPPFNSLRDPSPFTDLMEKFGVNICIYGHLHGKGGRVELHTQKNNIDYYLTSCDLLGFHVAEIPL